MQNWVIGVDLGATKIALGLIDPHNRITARRRIATEQARGAESVVARIAAAVADLSAELPAGESVAALGICSPGPVDHHAGALVDPPNMPGLHHAPLQQMLGAALGLPVRLEHDAKAAALGEYHYGAGRGAQSMVYIVAGTGVGAAIIIDGQIYRGLHNFAGEVGHITIKHDAEPCASGVPGCVQGYLCGPALARRYRALQPDAAPDVTGEQVAQLAAQNDSAAGQVLTQAGEALGVTVATLAMILNIDLYVVGGSVAKSGDLLLEPARRTVPRYAFESVAASVNIVATNLWADGAILGAGWLARQAINPSL